MRVYIAGPYSQKDAINLLATDLRRGGIEVTSRWLKEPHSPTTQMHELTHDDHRKYALRDIKDVVDADILVFINDASKTIVRGGRHVEFGIAVALGLTRNMPIFVLGGERENIFHHLPQVEHFEHWGDLKYQLADLLARGIF